MHSLLLLSGILSQRRNAGRSPQDYAAAREIAGKYRRYEFSSDIEFLQQQIKGFPQQNCFNDTFVFGEFGQPL